MNLLVRFDSPKFLWKGNYYFCASLVLLRLVALDKMFSHLFFFISILLHRKVAFYMQACHFIWIILQFAILIFYSIHFAMSFNCLICFDTHLLQCQPLNHYPSWPILFYSTSWEYWSFMCSNFISYFTIFTNDIRA